MSVQSDIAEIKAALEDAEGASQTARHKLKKLHNVLSQKLADNAELLGLTSGEVIAMGGGTDKP